MGDAKDLKQNVEWLANRAATLLTQREALRAENVALRAKLAEAVEALKFYRDEWKQQSAISPFVPSGDLLEDQGGLAIQALARALSEEQT